MEEVARVSREDKGVVVVVENLNDANRYANEYSPGHLAIHTSRPREVVSLLKNNCSLFIGENTAEVYVDKIAGPNHILLTAAAARYTSGLWVGMFLKAVTHMEGDGPAFLKLAKYAETQGSYEGMDAHRFAAAIRLKNLKD